MTSLDIQQAMQLALRYHEAGHLSEADVIYRQVLAQSPDHADALHLLGVLASQSGRPDVAVDLISRAIAVNPDFPAYQANLTVALTALGRTCYQRQEYSQSIDAYRRVITMRPDDALAQNNLANALRMTGQLGAAEQTARAAVSLAPNSPEAHLTLATILDEQSNPDAALPELQKALSLRPDYPQAHWKLGLMLLSRGEYESGFPEYEWRWQCPELGFHRRQFPQPQWDGSDLAGRKILVHVEQRFGDTMQFIRYAPLIAQRGGKAILLCEPELRRLLRTVPAIEQVITPGEPLPDFDVHYPLSSLAMLLKTTVHTIPATTPYLSADPSPAVPSDGRLNIGLVWSGNPKPNRSIPPDLLLPIAQVANVRLFSLQKGDAPRPPFEMIDRTADLHDFFDTASLISSLDLVITIDTAVAHLAGALGKPVWLLVLHSPDWRWMRDRCDSPWYPTMRLFRQPRPSDWQTPISQVVEALHQFAK